MSADVLADLFIVLCLGLAIGGSLSFTFELARARALRRTPAVQRRTRHA